MKIQGLIIGSGRDRIVRDGRSVAWRNVDTSPCHTKITRMLTRAVALARSLGTIKNSRFSISTVVSMPLLCGAERTPVRSTKSSGTLCVYSTVNVGDPPGGGSSFARQNDRPLILRIIVCDGC